MATGNTANSEALDYITRVIQHLEYQHGIIFFITPRDFHILYRWWEKRIPLYIIKESMASVITRRTEKKQAVSSFTSFYYEVKKSFKSFMELDIGKSTDMEPTTNEDEYQEITDFFKDYPDRLLDFKADFERIFEAVKSKEIFDLESLYQRLLEQFANDRELDVKVGVFTRHLAPALRKPDIIRKYRLNILLNQFHIPDFTNYCKS